MLLLCLLYVPTLTFANNNILIVTSSDSEYQQQLSKTIQTELAETLYKLEVTEADRIDENNIANRELVVAIGKDSVTIFSKNSFKAAVLDAIATSSKIKSTSKRAINKSKIHMTQPVCRQFRLIKALNREWKNVGLLLSKGNNTKASTLSSCGKKYDLATRIVTINDDSELVTGLNSALNNSDVLLSLPDLTIYNPLTIKNILLTSYRHRVPIIGFSESFANAGAIAAVHTSPKQLGIQIAKLVRDYFKSNKSLRQSEYYPSDFSVTTNQQVARSLEIEIQDGKTIESILKKMELGVE